MAVYESQTGGNMGGLWGQETVLDKPDLRYGKWSDDDCDIQYSLGNPSNGGDSSDIATKWGLGLLDKAGCINLNTNLDKQLYQDPVGKVTKERNSHNEYNSQIHSVFRKTSWQNFSDAQFAAIRPALLLASALLDEPAILYFFYAISTPETMITFDVRSWALARDSTSLPI
ncbi:hypothetical protein E4T43_01129 [Aureobasidium subglaciale]|nr:hypothetical protein E4T43_01129 [Aureobasidium subglaciale]